MANRSQQKKSCGNAGSVEREENQTQVFHSSHRPLEISPTPRDFHIPTAQAGRAWESGKPKSGFPLSHTRPATMTTVHFKKSKSKAKPNLAASGGKRTTQKRRSIPQQSTEFVLRIFRLNPHWNQDSFLGSFRAGIKHRFQAHFRIGKCSDAPQPDSASSRHSFGSDLRRCAPASSQRDAGWPVRRSAHHTSNRRQDSSRRHV